MNTCHLPLLSREEEVLLGWLKNMGSIRARNSLVEHNQRYVLKIAGGYQKRCDSMELDDLVQEGSIGLIKAANKYDWELGFRFTTNATWWIHQEIIRAITNTDRPVRLPVHIYQQIRKMWRLIEAGCSREELGKELTEDIDDLMYWDRFTRFPLHNNEEDPGEDSLEDDEFMEMITQEIEYAAGSDRDAAICKARLILDGRQARTLRQIADQYGIVTERVRQICRAIIKKLERK